SRRGATRDGEVGWWLVYRAVREGEPGARAMGAALGGLVVVVHLPHALAPLRQQHADAVRHDPRLDAGRPAGEAAGRREAGTAEAGIAGTGIGAIERLRRGAGVDVGQDVMNDLSIPRRPLGLGDPAVLRERRRDHEAAV